MTPKMEIDSIKKKNSVCSYLLFYYSDSASMFILGLLKVAW